MDVSRAMGVERSHTMVISVKKRKSGPGTLFPYFPYEGCGSLDGTTEIGKQRAWPRFLLVRDCPKPFRQASQFLPTCLVLAATARNVL